MLKDALDFITNMDAFTQKLTEADIGDLLNTLVYDGCLEEAQQPDHEDDDEVTNPDKPYRSIHQHSR